MKRRIVAAILLAILVSASGLFTPRAEAKRYRRTYYRVVYRRPHRRVRIRRYRRVYFITYRRRHGRRIHRQGIRLRRRQSTVRLDRR